MDECTNCESKRKQNKIHWNRRSACFYSCCSVIITDAYIIYLSPWWENDQVVRQKNQYTTFFLVSNIINVPYNSYMKRNEEIYINQPYDTHETRTSSQLWESALCWFLPFILHVLVVYWYFRMLLTLVYNSICLCDNKTVWMFLFAFQYTYFHTTFGRKTKIL